MNGPGEGRGKPGRARRRARLAACVVTSLAATLACSRSAEPQPAVEAQRLLPTIERLANLKARSTPVVREAGADDLRRYLVERLDETYPGDQLDRVAAVYTWLGLLPPGLNLRQVLIDLYMEQAVGFYDPKRDVLYVRSDAPPALLREVLAHELVHALQDQVVDLEQLISDRGYNDRQTAHQAAIEGHATLVMAGLQREQATGQPADFADLPPLGPLLRRAAELQARQLRVYGSAPRIIQESLIFPYAWGISYLQELWRAHPTRPPPFGDHLPVSTEQVLHPGTTRDRPTPVGFAQVPKGWALHYENDLGEHEIRIFLSTHLQSEDEGARAAAGWDGDRYALLVDEGGADTALVWLTVWDTEGDAEEFEAAYRRAFSARFGPVASEEGGGLRAARGWARVDATTLGGLPARRVVEARRELPEGFVRGLAGYGTGPGAGLDRSDFHL